MKFAEYAVTQEAICASLGFPPDAVIVRIGIGMSGEIEMIVHSDALPALPEGAVSPPAALDELRHRELVP